MNQPAPILLLTRPRAASERFAAQVAAAHGPGPVVIAPLMEIAARPVPPLPRDAAVAFTSENAVAIAAAAEPPEGRAAFCVGARTAQAARAAGYRAVTGGGDVAALARAIAAAPPGGPVWHLAGTHRAGDLAGTLRAAGIAAETVPVYDQQARPLDRAARDALAGPAPVVAALFSPRSARLLAEALPGPPAPSLVALSPAVAAAWTGPPPPRLDVLAAPEAAAMVAALGPLLRRRRP